MSDLIAQLEAESRELIFAAFTENDAWQLGQSLVALGQAAAAPIVISIRSANRTLFHASLPGASALNDLWALRKSNTALMFAESSYLITLRAAKSGADLNKHGLDPALYAASGGAVPIRTAAAGVVAVCTVSGLPQEDDHALVVLAIRSMLGK